MLRIYLFLVLAALPLGAQTSLNEADKVKPDTAPAVVPEQPPGNAVITPGIGAPPPGTPVTHLLPAPPAPVPTLTDFTISPGTLREGLTDKSVIRTTVTLSAPTPKALVFHIESSNPKMMLFDDVTVPIGQMKTDGYVTIDWKKVLHNCQVEAKAHDDENPEAQLSARVYLRKKIE